MGIRRSWVAGMALFGILVSPRPTADPGWLRFDGGDWQRWSPEERQAYVTGFLAGSATQQALAAAAGDSAGLIRAMDSVVQRRLSFAYAPNVYGVRVEDYYWWENHRPLPIWYVMWDVNRSLQQASGEGH